MPLEQMDAYKQKMKYIYKKRHTTLPAPGPVMKNGSTLTLASPLLFGLSSKLIQKL